MCLSKEAQMELRTYSVLYYNAEYREICSHEEVATYEEANELLHKDAQEAYQRSKISGNPKLIERKGFAHLVNEDGNEWTWHIVHFVAAKEQFRKLQEERERYLAIAYNAIRLGQLDERFSKRELLKELGCSEKEYEAIMD